MAVLPVLRGRSAGCTLSAGVVLLLTGFCRTGAGAGACCFAACPGAGRAGAASDAGAAFRVTGATAGGPCCWWGAGGVLPGSAVVGDAAGAETRFSISLSFRLKFGSPLNFCIKLLLSLLFPLFSSSCSFCDATSGSIGVTLTSVTRLAGLPLVAALVSPVVVCCPSAPSAVPDAVPAPFVALPATFAAAEAASSAFFFLNSLYSLAYSVCRRRSALGGRGEEKLPLRRCIHPPPEPTPTGASPPPEPVRFFMANFQPPRNDDREREELTELGRLEGREVEEVGGAVAVGRQSGETELVAEVAVEGGRIIRWSAVMACTGDGVGSGLTSPASVG